MWQLNKKPLDGFKKIRSNFFRKLTPALTTVFSVFDQENV